MKRARFQTRYFIRVFALALIMALTCTRADASVTISSFAAQAQTTSILVKWVTASELQNSGFNVLRSTSPNGPFTKINSSLVPVKNPGSILGSSYSFTDSNATKGQTLYYKLESVEYGGATQQFGPVNATIAVPTSTPTTAAPTATRTPTTGATATTSSASANPTATDSPTAISSSTSVGAPASTGTPFPTRVAQYVDPAALATATLPPAPRGRPNNPVVATSAPPKPIQPITAPTQASVVENSNPQNQTTANSSSDKSSSDSITDTDTKPNPLVIVLALGGGAAVITVLAIGAVAAYMVLRKFVG